MSTESETLDRLYLEWAQFTAARNLREVKARQVFAAGAASKIMTLESWRAVAVEMDQILAGDKNGKAKP